MNLSAVNANIVSRADKQRAPRMENTAKQIGYERTFENAAIRAPSCRAVESRSSDRRAAEPAGTVLRDEPVDLARVGDGFRRSVKSDLAVRAVAKWLVDGASAPAQRNARSTRGNRDRVAVSIG
jgi:hypothetical protein